MVICALYRSILEKERKRKKRRRKRKRKRRSTCTIMRTMMMQGVW